MRYRVFPKAVVLIMLAGAAGCSDSDKPKAAAPAPPQPKTVSTLTATQQVASAETPSVMYTYNPGGRRDPFTPLIMKEEKKALLGAKTPLERYAIHEFKLSGIVWGGLGYHAMLEGPDGKGYFVKPGTIIGPNRGKITKITQNTLVVEEQYRDPSGESKKKETVIELHKKEEGKP